ncbi:SpoIIAA family protein [Filimonas effusa]|uniref:STAS/SEC14 domain-containing protein n=1 Tax=Filimonas effusa TaxID=2508721 RepID=A0A4Q1D0C0_9BACT|nr:STAS/SEC14 domain-containing protein [Filimonas effusa]RXK81186.1 STAS/SEC14 domain-containing protein [Filimonas effusa]
MIEILTDVPANVAGFRAVGEVTKEDFKTVVMPVVDQVVIKYGELNYLMIIDSPLKDWTAGAWMQDLSLGLQELTKWNRVAIVSDSEALGTFTDIFSVLVPGEFRGFLIEELPQAVRWTATGE